MKPEDVADIIKEKEEEYLRGGMDSCNCLLESFREFVKETGQYSLSIEEIETVITEARDYYRNSMETK